MNSSSVLPSLLLEFPSDFFIMLFRPPFGSNRIHLTPYKNGTATKQGVVNAYFTLG